MGISVNAAAQERVTQTDSGGYQIEVTRSAPSTAPAAPAADASAEGGATEAPKAPARAAGGYAWSDAPKRRARATKIDPNWATATFPGFRMLQDGSSEISVALSKRVNVSVRKTETTITLVLDETYVRWSTNTLPLITTHFNTPVSSVRLKRGEKGQTLVVIQLREAADVRSKMEVNSRGFAVLRVQVPAARREFVQADQRAPLAVLPARR